MAKKYIDAELQIVRLNNRDIVTESLRIYGNTTENATYGDAADRMGREDWDAGY